jgi:hypothetical protein
VIFNERVVTRLLFAGPKSYSYLTTDHKTVCKVKGFTLDGKVEKVVNFPNMLNMLKTGTQVVATYNNILQRVKSKFIIKETDMQKRFRVTYDKRRIVDAEWNTLPFGFCSR